MRPRRSTSGIAVSLHAWITCWVAWLRRGRLRDLPGQSSLVVGGQDFTRDGGGREDHEATDFPFELGQHEVVFLRSGLAGLEQDLPGSKHRLVRLVFDEARGGDAGVFNDL